jgi:hypothetical protein
VPGLAAVELIGDLARRRLPQQVAAGLDAANQRSDDGGGDIRPVAPGALAADSKCL